MRNYGFVLFLVISFAISVPMFVVSTQLTSAGVIVLLLLLGSYAPALAAGIVVGLGGDEVEKMYFRDVLWNWVSGKWFLFAILMPSIVWLLAYFGSLFAKWDVTPVWTALAGLPVILFVNYGEEIGWRGYALPYLMKRLNPFTASLILGAIWGLFHVALTWQRPLIGFLTFCTVMILSVILAWLFIHTKSILPGTLLHAVFNAWTQVFVSTENVTVLVVATFLIIFVAGYLLINYGKRLAI